MVARNDDNPNPAPAGLSWGRRQPVSQDIAPARRGQVKGLFGSDPASPVPQVPAPRPPEMAESDPTDSFFGSAEPVEAATWLEDVDVVKTGARRAGARAWALPRPTESEY
jgi:hypothetical protein